MLEFEAIEGGFPLTTETGIQIQENTSDTKQYENPIMVLWVPSWDGFRS
jgi:hypothetical protein